MSDRLTASIVAVAAVLCLGLKVTAAQGPVPKAEGPPLPRTPDGRPDLSGVWRASPAGTYSLEVMELQVLGQGVVTPELAERLRSGKGTSRIVDPADGKIPYQPWSAARRKAVFDNGHPGQVDRINGSRRGLGAVRILMCVHVDCPGERGVGETLIDRWGWWSASPRLVAPWRFLSDSRSPSEQ